MKRDERTRTDLLVMVLSTDWFLPYWKALGLSLDSNEKGNFQTACREIVKQILSGAHLDRYFLTNFSDERVAETKQLFAKTTQRFAIPDVWVNTVFDTHLDEADTWTIEMLTQIIIDEPNKLPINLETVRTVKTIYPQFDLARLRTTSPSNLSDWDKYIWLISPEVPELLFTFVEQHLNLNQFKAFWLALRSELPEKNMAELQSWYEVSAREMTGERINWTKFEE